LSKKSAKKNTKPKKKKRKNIALKIKNVTKRPRKKNCESKRKWSKG